MTHVLKPHPALPSQDTDGTKKPAWRAPGFRPVSLPLATLGEAGTFSDGITVTS
jgi:hypothetical protein